PIMTIGKRWGPKAGAMKMCCLILKNVSMTNKEKANIMVETGRLELNWQNGKTRLQTHLLIRRRRASMFPEMMTSIVLILREPATGDWLRGAGVVHPLQAVILSPIETVLILMF